MTFTLDDARGAGGASLDRKGRLTRGAVSVGFVLGQLTADGAGEPGTYTAYTTRTVGSALQVMPETVPPESDNRLEVLDVRAGRYRYTLGVPLTGFDPARTQTVLAIASRGLAGTAVHASARRSVQPAGGAVQGRAVVEGARCASCHGELRKHEGRFDAVEQCAVCHTLQSSDPQTGNSLDFRVMVHRLHRGADLPMAQTAPYQLTDATSTTLDYSRVRYPQPLRRCDGCHGGAQGSSWQSRPDVAACTSCHDDVVFTTPTRQGEVQHGYDVAPDARCDGCHGATSGAAPVVTSHLDPALDTSHALVLEILPMATVPPGTPPSFTFRVTYDGQPRNIQTSPLASLRATLAGPNGDFSTSWTRDATTNPYVQVTLQGSGATGTLTPVDAPGGLFAYTFPPTVTIPASATGSFTLGLEGASSASVPRFAAVSPLRAFAVTDATAQARREVIDPARCNGCHHDLSAHGGNRRGAAYCVLCHNPQNANDERIARLEGSTVLAESLDFRVMIHKIHRGVKLSQPYVLGANPTPTVANPAGTMLSFNEVRYPRSTAECEACHLPGTWTLPAPVGRVPSLLQELTCTEPVANDADSYCTSPFWSVTREERLAPETSVCTSCHDAPYSLAHAQLNTTVLGVEACTACHGAGKGQDVARVHAR